MPPSSTPAEREGPVCAWLLYSNAPVGIIAAGFVLGNQVLMGIPISLPLLGLAFCGTFLVYQYERAIRPMPEDRTNHPGRLAWVERHSAWVKVSSTLAVSGVLAMLPALRPETIVAGLALAFLALLYALPLLPGRRRLKSFALLKPLAIAGAWAMGGVVLPAFEAGRTLDVGVAALVGYRFLFVLPNALLADWPDRAGDRSAGLSTLAARLSAARLRQWALASLLGATLCGVGVALQVRPGALLIIDGFGLLAMAAVVGRHPASTRWYYGFVIDAVVGWPVVTTAAWLIGGG